MIFAFGLVRCSGCKHYISKKHSQKVPIISIGFSSRDNRKQYYCNSCEKPYDKVVEEIFEKDKYYKMVEVESDGNFKLVNSSNN